MKSLPSSVIGLIEKLEQENPARVRQVNESELAHERFAGRVDLIAELRQRYDALTKKAKNTLPAVL